MKHRNILIVAFLLAIPVCFDSCTGCGSDEGNATVPHETTPVTEMPAVPAVAEEGIRTLVDNTAGRRVVIKMKKENGVYYIPVKINGTEMDFIFDTGAGIISMSSLEATFLYKQGKIRQEDILGTENVQDATGNISEGAVVNLREVTIGGITIENIRAIVSDNVKAPLLLGQSALEKFGKITIDYRSGEITFQ